MADGDTDRVKTACAECFAAHRNDCSGFVTAVGAKLGVAIRGMADAMVDTLRAGGAWTRLADGRAAAQAAAAGKLVVAGLKGSEQAKPSQHGHVVVVVAGPLDRDAYPTAYWGSLGGTPYEATTINYAWTLQDLPKVTYAQHELPPPLPAAAG